VPSRLKLRHALALALAHGPTELLPISSTAHTTLVARSCRLPYAQLDPQLRKAYEVALHAGGGLALAIEMREELLAAAHSASARDGAVIAASLAPPALAGLLLGPLIARRLSHPHAIAAALVAGAPLIALADRRPGLRVKAQATIADGLALGLAQAAALAPGVSRSGATLAVARARGFARRDAHALSRHTGLAVIFAACLREGARLAPPRPAPVSTATLATGAVGAFSSTIISVRLQRRTRAQERPLWPYALYRLLIAALIMRRRAS
jgi:undecaprenyl-diphosphatase